MKQTNNKYYTRYLFTTQKLNKTRDHFAFIYILTKENRIGERAEREREMIV
jgi:hypothetical protein